MSNMELQHNRSAESCVTEATSSLEMEGFHVDEEAKNWCAQVLRNELTKEEYLKRILAKAGVAA